MKMGSGFQKWGQKWGQAFMKMEMGSKWGQAFILQNGVRLSKMGSGFHTIILNPKNIRKVFVSLL